jgi:hypothetical protein
LESSTTRARFAVIATFRTPAPRAVLKMEV